MLRPRAQVRQQGFLRFFHHQHHLRRPLLLLRHQLSHPPNLQSDGDSPDDVGDGAEDDDGADEVAPLDFVFGAAVAAAADGDGVADAPGQSPIGLATGRVGPGPPSRPKS